MSQDLEYDTRSLKIDETLQAEAQKLRDDGWTMMSGVCVYHLVRTRKQPQQPQPPEFGGMGHLIIDESKVFIIPAKDRH